MARRIGEILVEEGACSAASVREALQNQVIFGGRVGTNLLELDALSEEALASALARRLGCRHVSGPIRPEPEAVRLVSRELADRCEVVPYALGERAISVAACDPGNLATLDELAFATGRRVHAAVAAEVRIWALLRSTYGIVRQLRGIELEADPLAASRAASTASARAPAGSKPGDPGDLIDETEFEALYGHIHGGAEGAGPGDAVIDLTAEMLEPVPPAPAPNAPAPSAPPPIEPGPLGFAEAVAALSGVAERAAIARIVLRYARTRVRRAVLFTVNRGFAHGWVGLGGGLSPAAVQGLRQRLGTPGVLDTVVRTRAHYLGPLPRTEANVRLLKALGDGVPKNALLVPILALGRVVNVLYADGGRGQMVDGDGVGELLILATRIAQSYDALVARV